MKIRFFLPLFLLILILLADAAGTGPVAGNPAIADPLPGTLLAGTTTRVSVASDGTQGNARSQYASTSGDGRYIAFTSLASNLVPGDTNDRWDVFVHDQETGQTSRVSVSSDGAQGNDDSQWPSISADGRYVAFQSRASNLVAGDTNGVSDTFVHDRETGQTSRVSVASNGTQGNSWSYEPSISADGRYVAFYSIATNLVPGDTNGADDVFVHDRQTGETSRVSIASDGTQGNSWSVGSSISADGRYVAFSSSASNLVPGDTNNRRDIFVHNRQTGQTSRISVASNGNQGNGDSFWPSLSANGRYVAFSSAASNLVPGDTNNWRDVFVHDIQTGETSRISITAEGTQGNGVSEQPSISADGRYVAFHSAANNLVPDDINNSSDIFVHDRYTGQIQLVSTASDGTQGDNGSTETSISGDGHYIAFRSAASNLAPDDTNGVLDIFVHRRQMEIEVTILPDQGTTLNYTDVQGLTTTITISTGAVVTNTLLIYTPIDEITPPASLQFAGRAFELTAYQNGTAQPGFTFLQPVNVSLTYSSEQVADLQEDALSLQVLHGDDWSDAAETCSPASAYIRDTASNSLSVDICHLSQFALMGTPGFSIYLPLVVRPGQP
jgi:Tol biopolymer transport system component